MLRHKKLSVLVTVLAGGLFMSQANGQLIISEVVDATLTGGLPKYVEITNTCSDVSVDMSLYSIGNMNNGSTLLGGGASTQLTGILAPGDSYVISYEASDGPGVGTFFNTYGFDPDNFSQGAFINGDDVVILFKGPATGDASSATIVDQIGRIGQDGSGQDWDYEDSWCRRNPNVLAGNQGTFLSGEWTCAGANSLDSPNNTVPAITAATNPGSHAIDGLQSCTVPGSTPFSAGAFALIALLGGMLVLRGQSGSL